MVFNDSFKYNSCKNYCLLPYCVVFIDGFSGDVYPCNTTIYRENNIQYIMGNVLKDKLENIWHNDKFNSFRKQVYPRLNSECYYGCDPSNIIN